MKIQDLFLKPVNRPIDGVIKADDTRNIVTELEEYVVTRDVSKGLGILADRYLNEVMANGVWVSGFFGSGKSHLLKILALILDGGLLADGRKPADVILPKIDDEIVRGDLRKAALFPSRSVLFNIDQKFDGIGGDHTAPILEVFVKVLNELQGYYGKQGHIAQFEYDLDKRGEFTPFKNTYLRLNGSAWETDREAIGTARRAAFAKAYAEHFAVGEDEALGLLSQIRRDYRVSIESFAQRVKEYIDQQPPGFRLNFFVDEVGQFIGQDSKLMLNLQTVTETLGTVCSGRSWVFVTSQADLEGIIGTFRNIQAQDISKIMGRFKTQITLASADVREVIQKRLLAKKEPEPEVLTAIYDREKENLQTLFRFGEGSVQLKGWRGSDEFCALYPFHTYQFALFQLCIQQLSKHSVFIGRYVAVGERSMLAVFQEVAKTVCNSDVGRLATFDLMYDGIAATIRGDMQATVRLAENQLGDRLQLQIVKALFLLKWVPQFKTTARNIAILLIDAPQIDIAAHEKAVRTALAELTTQNYLQQNNDLFEFLTDTEKDIEKEIKSTEVDDSQVATLLSAILFSDVLRDPKIRYEENGQDYAYARKLDDQCIGRDADVDVNIVTSEHPNYGDIATLAAQNTGKSELLVILPPDSGLTEQTRIFLKTEKYIQQHTGAGDTTRQAILDQRRAQNGQRRNAMVQIASDLLSKAPLYLNGSRLDTVGNGEPRNRFHKACQSLVSLAFPSLRMLRGSYDDTSLSKSLLDADDLLSSGGTPPTEAEQELLNYVIRNQSSGDRTSVEEILRVFARRPYGWYPMAVLTFLSRLFRMGKVELRTSELLDAQSALILLRNSRQHANIRVRLQEQFSPAQIHALKKFHHDFFDRANPGTDARSAAQYLAEDLDTEARTIALLVDQTQRYPFLDALRPVLEKLKVLAKKDYTYLLNHLAEFGEELLDAKDDLISPIRAFMHGAQRPVYDDVTAFLREEAANFAEIPAAGILPLRTLAGSPTPYRGNAVPAAKAAAERARGQIAEALRAAREEALRTFSESMGKVEASADFVSLPEPARQQVRALAEPTRDAIQSERFVSAVRDTLNRYLTVDYPSQLALASRLAAEARGTYGSGNAPPQPTVRYVPASSLRPQCPLTYVASESDLDQWLAALRTTAKAELDQGHRISL